MFEARKVVNVCGIVALVSLFLVAPVLTDDATSWSVDGRYVTLDGKPFTFKGINYSPMPIGTTQGDDGTDRGDVFSANFDFIYNRDLGPLRATGANSVRLYSVYPWIYPSAATPNFTASVAMDHTPFLDLCWNNGVDPVFVWMTFNMGTSFHVATTSTGSSPDGRPTWRLPSGETAYMDPAYDVADSIAQEVARNAFVSIAQLYGTHPAVAAIVISNEQNAETVRPSWQFWEWFDTTAMLVKQAAPTKLTAMTLVDDAMLSLQYAESFGLPNMDVWGINSYRGTVNTGFDSLFSDFAAMSNKPLVIGEYGVPSSGRDGSGNIVLLANNAKAQGDYIVTHYNDMVANRNVCSGGFIFEWTDEWWKYMNPATHDATPFPNGAYPGGWDDEEWFGLNGIALSSPDASPTAFMTRGPDVLTPRASVAAITAMFAADVAVPPQAPPTPITHVPFSPYAPSISNVPQNPPSGLSPVPIGAPTPHSPAAPNAPSSSTTTPPSSACSLNVEGAVLIALGVVTLAWML